MSAEPLTVSQPPRKHLLRRVPELTLLLTATLISYLVIAFTLYSGGGDPVVQSKIIFIILGSFVMSLLLAVVAVVGGVGGGVIFTPLMLGFTSVDTMIVRATGLVVAMFSGLVSSGPLMRKGLADIKLVFFGAVPIIIGSILGARSAITVAEQFGDSGDSAVRLVLGLITLGVASLFVLGGGRSDYPDNQKTGELARLIGLHGWYHDVALDQEVHYKVRRGRYGLLLLLLVGFVGGFFGLGGGFAVVPVYNLMMYVPLKLAAGCSGVLLALGNAAAIWPYITAGFLLPLFVAPWMMGQVIGGIAGAHLLANVKASVVRKTLVVLLVMTSAKLIARGLEGLFGIAIPIL